MIIGIVGKPNTGKSTFFNAVTLASVPTASYPFTTIEPNVGVAHVRKRCVCKRFDVEDNPQNSHCIDGNRFIPVKMVDTAGLVPGAWEGRGLGNQFLDKIARADAMIHIIDLSGGTDLEGNTVAVGSHDPAEDIEFLIDELVRWLQGIVERDWPKLVRTTLQEKISLTDVLYRRLSGLNIDRSQIEDAMDGASLRNVPAGEWEELHFHGFAASLLRMARPILLLGNKADIEEASTNLTRLQEEGHDVIPASAVSELALRRAADKGFIQYMPGDADFQLTDDKSMTESQVKALERIRRQVLSVYDGTGIQRALNHAVFEILEMIAIYPVSNAESLKDGSGNVLPDVYLMRKGSTVRDLANEIHTDIAESMLYAIDAKSKKRLGPEHKLEDDSVIQIVSTR